MISTVNHIACSTVGENKVQMLYSKLSGVSEREGRSMVCTTPVGQRSTYRRSSVQTFHQFSHRFTTETPHLQLHSESSERSLWPRSVRTAAKPRHLGEFAGSERRPTA